MNTPKISKRTCDIWTWKYTAFGKASLGLESRPRPSVKSKYEDSIEANVQNTFQSHFNQQALLYS